jgi:hypothetical protein
VVDRGGLENRWVNSPGGSNPSLSDSFLWRGAREAEGDGLLNRCTGNGTEGSNPSFSG